MSEEKPEFLVFEGRKEEPEQSDADSEEAILEIVEDSISTLRKDKDRLPLRKVIFITCFGESEAYDYDKFILTAININSRDFTHITERLKLQYLLNEC